MPSATGANGRREIMMAEYLGREGVFGLMRVPSAIERSWWCWDGRSVTVCSRRRGMGQGHEKVGSLAATTFPSPSIRFPYSHRRFIACGG